MISLTIRSPKVHNIIESRRSGDLKDDANVHWTKQDIANQYQIENADWSWEECLEKADVIYRELNRLNRDSFKSRDRFFTNNTPFSFFESEDGDWSSVPGLN